MWELDSSPRWSVRPVKPERMMPEVANRSAAPMSAHAPPIMVTTQPADTRPAMRAVLAPSARSALPCWRSLDSSTSGMMPVNAGIMMAMPIPLNAAAAHSSHTGGSPVRRSAASRPNAVAEENSPSIITRWRGKRSAITPPISRNTIIGTLSAVSTIDSSSLSPPGRCRTPNARATGANADPPIDAVRAQKRRAKRRSRMSDQSARMRSGPSGIRRLP